MGIQNNELSTRQTEQTTGLARDVRRLAGKGLAFSMPKNKLETQAKNYL